MKVACKTKLKNWKQFLQVFTTVLALKPKVLWMCLPQMELTQFFYPSVYSYTFSIYITDSVIYNKLRKRMALHRP